MKIVSHFFSILLLLLIIDIPFCLNASTQNHSFFPEAISFDLIAAGGSVYTETIGKDFSALIFVFSSRCISCNPNMGVWNRLSRNNKIRTIGISMGLDEKELSFDITEFPLFIPSNVEDFEDKLNLRDGIDYSFLYINGKRIFAEIGNLNLKDYIKIKSLIKRCEK